MPFRRLKLRQLYKRIMVALLVGVTLLLLGGVAVIWQTVSEIRQDAESRLQRAQLMFDRTLGYAQQAATNVEGVIGAPCSEAALLLREQVIMVPDVRSANLAIGSRIYCTSLYGAYDGPFGPDDYVDGKLQLLSGNATTPDRPLIVLRHETDKGECADRCGWLLPAQNVGDLQQELPYGPGGGAECTFWLRSGRGRAFLNRRGLYGTLFGQFPLQGSHPGDE